MKNITSKITLFIAAAALCISINACKKSTTDSDLSTVQDNAQAESESNYIGSAADAGAANTNQDKPESTQSNSYILPSCATSTFAAGSGNVPNMITITFNNCVCYDGKTRNGSIIVTWPVGYHYRDSGIVIHTYTSGYTVNGNTHQYSKWVTNIGRVNGYYTFDINDTATITFPKLNNETISWTSSRVRTWTQGYNTPLLFWNTIYSITGSASGTDKKGIPFTVNITSPIIANFGCIYIITGGTYDVQPQGKAERVISFVGGCSGNATCTINGITYTFQFANY